MYEKKNYSIIGKSHNRIDVDKQLSGEVKYTGDYYVDGMLYAKGILSPYDHAKIHSIDISEALAVPGVEGVATAKDVKYNRLGIEPCFDQPVFAEDKVRYKGELVALVAADTYETACRAAKLVKVEYEELPAVFDPREAIKEDAPILHEDKPDLYRGNIHIVPATGGDCQKLRYGDIEKGFAEADHIIEKEFATCPRRAAPIENFVTLAVPDGSDAITIYAATQCPHGNAGPIAHALGMPLSKVRIINPAMGGGFGVKNYQTTEAATATLALKIGKPVKWACDTQEMYNMCGTNHGVYFKYKIGFKNDGTLVALQRKSYTAAGAYRGVAILITMKITYWGCGPYNIPNQAADCYVVATNRNHGVAFRGFGMAQPTFALEVLMDMIAEKLQMDPYELRKKNLIHDRDHMPTGQVVRSSGIEMTLDKVAEMSEWTGC